MHYYEVAPTKIIRSGSDTFTYEFTEDIEIGSLVNIPVSKTTQLGIIIKRTNKPEYATRAISSVLNIPPIPNALLKTALWMSGYYAAPLATVLQTILPSGLNKKRRNTSGKSSPIHRKRTNFVLNKEQLSAVAQLSNTKEGTVLLHGVTGSGKTAVYIEYAKKIIESGRSVVVLVPEIALTPQLIAEFSNFFTDVIISHSKQTEAERHRAWLDALQSKTPRVAIGARSAFFLPLSNVGAIIIDEAHEPSFKQDKSPRYSALRVATILGKFHGAPVIQGSATPLVSEYFLATHNKDRIINLPNRAQPTRQPQIATIDMTLKKNFIQHRFLSDKLLSCVAKSLEQHTQTLIFHNRRGSASTTLCTNCGWSALCPRCFVPFTLHADKHILRCHICDNSSPVPTSCPSCHETDIIHKGIGTKLIESELTKLFPSAKIARFDGDIDNSNGLHKRYQEIYDGKVDIIIGTQTIAKGLDLPHLRTVGIIQADAGLALPDFMARERTFQLLSQVVGRVGRTSAETSVIVQSYQPEDDTVRFGITQNYDGFYKSELSMRKKGHFPPYTFLLKLTCIYKTEAAAIKNSQKFVEFLRKKHLDVIFFGPTPAFYERQRDTYRWQIIVKSPKRATLLEIITQLPPAHWQYDIDPMNLL